MNGTTQYNSEDRYDAAGNLDFSRDAEGKLTDYTYDGLNRLTLTTTPANTTVENVYDDRDNILRVINEKNIAIRRYEYDRKNRVETEFWPGGETFEYRYDANDNLIQKTDGKGQITVYEYDAANRLDTRYHYPDQAALTANTPAKTVSFSYDDADRLTGYDDGTTSAVYTYDNEDRKLTETLNLPGSITVTQAYTYYDNGLKKTYTGPDNITYTYTYDKGNRLASVQLPGEGSIVYNSYKWYQPEKVTLPGGNNQEYGYDPLMRVERIQLFDSASTNLLDYEYTYDEIDNVLTKTTEHGAYSYDYDDRDRLIDADNPTLGDEAFTYDPAGNRETDASVTGQWQYNDNNQLETFGDITLDYDGNGSTTQKSVSGSPVQRYVYNLENRLAEVRDGADALIASYYYDPFGRRIFKDVSGTRTYFAYSEEGMVAELDDSGSVTRSYGYSPNGLWGTGALFMRSASGYAYYQHDHLATPQQMIDSTGAKVWEGRQKAFGEVQEVVGAGENELRFPGQYYDAETGLYYNYFRYYEPSLGRYITDDPIGIAGGINSYLYVSSQPTVLTDPLGLDPYSGFISGWTGGTTDELPPVPPAEASWQMLREEHESTNSCTMCRFRCWIKFFDPIPRVTIEHGAEKLGEKIGPAAKEIMKDGAKKINKVVGAVDLASCLDGCKPICEYRECVDQVWESGDYCFERCDGVLSKE